MGCCLQKRPRMHFTSTTIPRRDSLDLLRSRLEILNEIPNHTDGDNFEHLSLRAPSWISFQSDFGIDKDVYIEDEAMCPICANEFDELAYLPRILPCGHTFCNECVHKLAKSKLNRYVQCPLDRKKHRTKHQNHYDDTLTVASINSSRISIPLSFEIESVIPTESRLDLQDSDVIPSSTTSIANSFASTTSVTSRNFPLPSLQQGSVSSLSLNTENDYPLFEQLESRRRPPLPQFVRTLWDDRVETKSTVSEESVGNSTPSPDYSSDDDM